MVPISLQERDCCGRMGNKVLGKLEVQVYIVFARAFKRLKWDILCLQSQRKRNIKVCILSVILQLAAHANVWSVHCDKRRLEGEWSL